MTNLQRSLTRYIPVTAHPNEPAINKTGFPPDVVGLRWGKPSSFEFSHGTIRFGGDDGWGVRVTGGSNEKVKRRKIIDVEVEVQRDEMTYFEDHRIPGHLPGEQSKDTFWALVPSDVFWTMSITLPRTYFGEATEPKRRYEYVLSEAHFGGRATRA